MTRERPILFSGPMVRAIIDGRKTQTRRLLTPPPPAVDVVHAKAGIDFGIFEQRSIPGTWAVSGPVWAVRELMAVEPGWRCPFGVPGDLLWVREVHYRFGHWEPVATKRTRTGRQKWRFVADTDETRFDQPDEYRKGRHHKDPYTPAWHKRLARFMPRALARITLEITDVRVQRLQDISEADIRAEGVQCPVTHSALDGCWRTVTVPCSGTCGFLRDAWVKLWDSINGQRAPWSSNPWVWAVSFKVVTP